MKKVKSFSRNLLGLGLFMGSTLMINAQKEDLAVLTSAIPTYSSVINSKTSVRSNTKSSLHTYEAIEQIRKHISSQLSYTDIAVEYNIEGTIVVEVSMDKEGKISNKRIIKKLQSGLDQAVINSLGKLTKVNIDQDTYQGVNTVHIPIRFTNSL